MANKRLTMIRLQKQQRQLQQDPIPHVMVVRKNLLHFHFLIFGLDGPYKNGFYHAALQLSEEYPFAPPRLIFYTQSGRFETGKPICTSFTNFHKQTWTAGWNVRTMIIATISFMTSDEAGVGGLNDNYLTRRSYADKSWEMNMKSQQFRQLFGKKLREHPETKGKFQLQQSSPKQTESQTQQSLGKKNDQRNLNILYIALGVLLLIWFLSKVSKVDKLDGVDFDSQF